MINLLPKKNKKELLEERNRNMILILCFLVLFFIVSLTLVFVIINTYIYDQIKISNSFLKESEQQEIKTETQELEKEIKQANDSFKKLDSFYSNKVYFSDIIKEISAIFPQNFYLSNFSINANDQKVTVNLSGFAPLREDLLSFKESLETRFDNVFLPASNWVNKKDVDFYITFETNL